MILCNFFKWGNQKEPVIYGVLFPSVEKKLIGHLQNDSFLPFLLVRLGHLGYRSVPNLCSPWGQWTRLQYSCPRHHSQFKHGAYLLTIELNPPSGVVCIGSGRTDGRGQHLRGLYFWQQRYRLAAGRGGSHAAAL